MARLRTPLLALIGALSLVGCGQRRDGALDIAFIATPEELFASGARLGPAAQTLRAATASGLVAFDENGEVMPALADRWIVTDDGLSFIFRLRDGTWPDGREMTAESVRGAMRAALRRLRGTALGVDLEPIDQVRAMAGRVVEIRLSSPVPNLLQLLAQPELALANGEGGAGPMLLTRQDSLAVLSLKAPADRGLPAEEDWEEHIRSVRVHAADARRAIAMFDDGLVEVVLGGTIGSLPLAPAGPLSRGTVRMDPAMGLFGLQVRRAEGVLATPEGRESIAMALDRNELLAPFSIGGWSPTTRIVAPNLPGDPGLVTERWAERGLDELRASAAMRVARLRSGDANGPVRLTLAIGDDPGLQTLFRQLSTQLATIGIALEREPDERKADLVLVDKVARYDGPRWFLDQFNCALKRGLCDADADFLVEQSLTAADAQERASLLAEAEASMTLSNIFIPFGPPLRWSLVRGNVEGFAANRWAFHPLPPMALLPR
ncbi:conserved hypothetical protein [Altererythrobacter sp. B11]|uniref:ABC transporter substrate-binding protein n=1 Tax=Altererythrobacter sp. B11 TaxID=2060312 RepID=UPI000DC71185|nr:ABC transporter substrate-binding protein [Altererythrobacter sp. B11]BBC71619.1 conserved hypothetical protein [Altererythrobacter sp. B11]